MSQNSVTFLVALVGLVGVAVGVIISLTLTELINIRDYHQRNKSIWNLLRVEVNHIITLSNENKLALEKAKQNKKSVIIATRFPNNTWQSILSNGEFISQVPKGILDKMIAGYRKVEIYNATVDQYSTFVAVFHTSRERDFTEVTLMYYNLMLENCSEFATYFTGSQETIIKEEKLHEKKVQNLRIAIKLCIYAGWLSFVALIFLCIYALVR